MLEDADAKPTAAFIGLPPKYHGSLEDPKANIEVQLQLMCTSLASQPSANLHEVIADG